MPAFGTGKRRMHRNGGHACRSILHDPNNRHAALKTLRERNITGLQAERVLSGEIPVPRELKKAFERF